MQESGKRWMIRTPTKSEGICNLLYQPSSDYKCRHSVFCLLSIIFGQEWYHMITALQFGALTSIEMVTAVLVYIPVAYLADRSTKKPFVAITFVFFTLFPLVLLFSRSFEMLILAFVLRGLKEFGEPTRKALIMDLSPNNCRAGMFGLYYLIRDIIVAFAALGGALLWQISPQANLITAFVFGVVGTIGFMVFGRDVQIPIPQKETANG